MSASSSDYFQKVGDATVTTLAAPGKALAATSITVGSTTNYPTDTGVTIAIRVVDTDGELVAGTYTEWVGTVTSGTTFAINGTPVYGSDQVYAAGSTTQVYIGLSKYAHNRLVDGLLVAHDQDGTLKAGAVDNAAVLANDVVTTAKILDSNVTTAKIADNNVTAAKLATNAITLGYAAITSNFVTASTTVVQVTGLSATVTIPSGGRRIKITAFGSSSSQTSATVNVLTIWDGTVGSGTQLAQANQGSGAVGLNMNFICVAVVTPSAGSKTYNVGFYVTGGTGTLGATSTQPVFVLVEAI